MFEHSDTSINVSHTRGTWKLGRSIIYEKISENRLSEGFFFDVIKDNGYHLAAWCLHFNLMIFYCTKAYLLSYQSF